MPIYPRAQKQFPIPSEGQHGAVLGAIQDLGLVLTEYGEKWRYRLVWLLDEIDPAGQPLLALQSVTNSSGETGNLFKIFKTFTGIEIDETTDLEQFIGAQALLTIQHNKGKSGRIYANILLPVLKASKGQCVQIPANWEPPEVKNRASERGSYEE